MTPSGAGHPHRAGRCALIAGAVALLCALIPVIGDLIAVPMAVLAIVCGIRGVGHHDAGRSPRMMPSVVGALLGAIALLLVVVAWIATGAAG